MPSYWIELGDYRFEIDSEVPLQVDHSLYLPFLKRSSVPASHAPVDARIQVIQEKIPDGWTEGWSSRRFLADTRSTWAIARMDHPEWKFQIGPSPAGPTDPPMLHLLADDDFGLARVYLDMPAGSRIEGSHIYPLDEVYLHHFASARGALVVHASGVEIAGKGYLFLGDSGAGKSTIAELLEESLGPGKIFSDDRILLCDPGRTHAHPRVGWRMFGTPWHGTLPRILPHGVELGGLFFLEKAERHQIHPLSHTESLERLLKTYLGTWWITEWVPRQLAAVEALVSSPNLTCARLAFARDPGIAGFLLEHLRK